MTQADSVHSTPPLNTSATNPTAGLDWLDIAADAKPADIFRAIGRLRKEAKDEIDRLIRFLDETDNHMELEPNGDELDASWPERGPRPMASSSEDDEPSRGSFDRMLDQGKAWQQRSLYAYPAIDGEHDHADDEPSLGSLDHNHSQDRWAVGGRRDLEEDLSESGIADFEGLYEQVGTQDWSQGSMG